MGAPLGSYELLCRTVCVFPWGFGLFALLALSGAASAQKSDGTLNVTARTSPVVLTQAVSTTRKPDVVYIPTPQKLVNAMLEFAKVSRTDVVYDLGCGDGRIVMTAAQRYGARGVGVDIDPQRVREASANVRAAALDGRVQIVQGDLLAVDLKNATVVALYLSMELNQKLRPKLLAELRPGSRVVSHHFDMGDWIPEQTVSVDGEKIFLWRIPAGKD